MKVVISDLDGTLLDGSTYSWEPARPAIERLKSKGIPLVLCSSKTRAEVEQLRNEMGNSDPFIVENGGALFVPKGYFPFRPSFSRDLEAYDVVDFGAHYSELVSALAAAADRAKCKVLGFAQLTPEQLAAASGLSLRQSLWAKQREYDESFEVTSGDVLALLHEIEAAGYRWTKGSRYYHITGNNDKGLAVMLLLRLYYQVHKNVVSIGLGDSLNDAELLSAVDVPFLVRSDSEAPALLRRVPRARVTGASGPQGWNDALLEMIP